MSSATALVKALISAHSNDGLIGSTALGLKVNWLLELPGPLLVLGVASATAGLAGESARVVAWELPLAERLTRFAEWPSFLLGGLRGAIEPLLLGAILAPVEE